MTIRLRAAFFAFSLLVAAASSAHAQFLQTDLNTYQLPDPRKEIVIVATELGLFIAYAPNRSTPLSGFDVQQLTTNNSASVFLAYGTQPFVPDHLVFPGQKNEFRVRGSFTLFLGKTVRLSVAMISNLVPYITVVSSDKGQEAIIGFVGRQVVLNLKGSDAVEIFEADQARHQFPDVAPPYELRKDNHLYLKEQQVPHDSAVGLYTQPDNGCLQEKSPLVWEDDFSRLQDLMKAEPPMPFKRALRKIENRPSISTFLPLTVSNESIVGIHYDTGRFVDIRGEQAGDDKVCLVKILNFKK